MQCVDLVAGPSAVVGSSRMSIEAPDLSAFAISTSCCSATDRSLTAASTSMAISMPPEPAGAPARIARQSIAASALRPPPEIDVLRDGQGRDEREFLEHRRDPRASCGDRICQDDRLALLQDLAGRRADKRRTES